MKNFKMRCTMEGTSALKPKFEHQIAEPTNIIAFPGGITHHEVSLGVSGTYSWSAATRNVYRRFLNTDMVQSLRYGTSRGHAFGRIDPRQAAAMGIVFSVFALGSILLSC